MKLNINTQRAAARSVTLAALCACVAAWLLVAAVSPASAAPPVLWNACDGGPDDTQCSIPRGIAADPDDGHVFVVDQANRRLVEFNALGEFVKAWGWDVVASGPGDDVVPPEDQFEICVPEDGDVCQGGVSGTGAGQLGVAQGVALDSAGNVYVVDWLNFRVQKFDPDGNFLLMFGDGVNQGPLHPGDVCTAQHLEEGDSCGAGAKGAAGGQFSWSEEVAGSYIAVDPTDDVYVGDQNRIQRFDTGGAFQDECTVPGTVVRSLAVDGSGNLYAAYHGQAGVRKLSFVAGAACEELARFELPKPDSFTTNVPVAVAVDSASNVYAFGLTSCCGGTQLDPIFEFDPAANIVDNFGQGEFSGSTGLATNLCPGSPAPGNLYVSDFSGGFLRAYGTFPTGCLKAFTGQASNLAETAATLNGTVNPKGAAVTTCEFEYGETEGYGLTVPCVESGVEIGSGGDPVPVHADISALTRATVYHFRLVARIGGELERGSDQTFKTLGPPVVSDSWTAGATDTEASLRALVNPEGLATTYHFEYGTDATYGHSTPAVPIGSSRADQPAAATITGLAPGATYHWRVVAVNSSDQTAGPDHTLTTYRPTSPELDCPNRALRRADSAFLPDCRAYEMVSPVDKNGGDIVTGPGGYIQVSPGGERIAYSSTTSFGDQQSSLITNQYLASRGGADGWETTGIRPPVAGRPVGGQLIGLLPEFLAFSPDLCSAWLLDIQTPPATPEAQEGAANLLRRDNCGPDAGELEALVPSPPALPADTDPEKYVDSTSLQGISADGSHAFFLAQFGALPHTPQAAASENNQTYVRVCPAAPDDLCHGLEHGAHIEVASVLPDSAAGDPAPGDGSGFADPSNTAVGSGWQANLHRAVSTDGSRLYWTSGANIITGIGKVYLRSHPEQGIVADECSEPSLPCTQPVSGTFPAFFWTATPDGSRALYSEQNPFSGRRELFLFEIGQPRRRVAQDIRGVSGWSADLSRIYFVSNDALAAGQNSEGAEPLAGQPNLYLDDAGTLRFVATLVEGDVTVASGERVVPYNLAVQETISYRATRVTPDGGRIVFQSRATPTGFDNTDAASGAPAVEVFTYEAGGALRCISCSPSGARPHARLLSAEPDNPRSRVKSDVSAAAWIPGWRQPLNPWNVLSADGGRIFFNSNDPLLPRDTNGAQDVYEWEAPGHGSCDTTDPDYFPRNGGCLYLISSGESPQESEFWGATPDGSDVFFITASSLLTQDPGLFDLYDARVGGGIPEPIVPAACEGEACQTPPAPPDDPTPASSAFEGAGNVVEEPAGCGRPARKARRLAALARRQRRAARRAAAPDRAVTLRRRAGRSTKRARRLSKRARRCGAARSRDASDDRRTGR